MRSAHGRLREAHRHWHDALARYSDLDGLRTYLNGTVQALRNVTFTLQSSKSLIPQFEQWYGTWQAAFRADDIMRWAVDSRNRVVKDSDLETSSRARVALIGSLDGQPMMEVEAPPTMSNRAIAAQLMRQLAPSDSLRRNGMVRIERRWVDVKLPEMEVLEALVHVFGRLSQLLVDCHLHIQRPSTSPWRASRLREAKSHPVITDGLLRPMCMIAVEDSRTSWLRVSDGSELALAARPINPDRADAEIADRWYGGLGQDAMREAFTAKTIVDRARGFWKAARLIMEKDGYHSSMVWLFRDGALVWHSVIEFPDNASKHLYWDELRRQVERWDATEIVTVSERWRAPFDPLTPDRRAEDAPEREETLGVDALNSDGQSITIYGLVERANGTTKVGEPQESEAKAYYLDEVRLAWGLPLEQDSPP